MIRYPLWKYLVVVFAIVLGTIYAMPNLYAPDPAVQISGYAVSTVIDEALLSKAERALKKEGIEVKGTELGEGNALVRLTSYDDQLTAQTILKSSLNRAGKLEDYIIALNQASTTPQWLRDMGAEPMNLGLDLAGGVHFVLEVDTPRVVKQRLEDYKLTFEKGIRSRRLYNVKVEQESDAFRLIGESKERQEELVALVKEDTPELVRLTGNDDNSYWVRAQIPDQMIREIEDAAVSQNLSTLRNRVNELGVSEPLVQKQGRNRIIVELPGVQDTAQAKKIIGKTANLEFRLVAEPNAPFSKREKFDRYEEEEQAIRGSVYLEREIIITGENVVDAQRGFDPETSLPQVNITLDSDGGTRMHRKTRHAVGRPLGVLFIEYRPKQVKKRDENGNWVEVTEQVAVKKVISDATIQSALGKNFRTTGLNEAEAGELALLLRSGAIAAPMVFVEERTIGPSLGAENIELGVKSVQLGMVLVVIFMIFFYRVFGLAANIALAINVVLLAAFMSTFGATLTLPGIAGIVLTVGMAVDANVLIFSRIREELKNGIPPHSAIRAGFDRAFTTILDANITTLIVALILFGIGSGPVKGFAVTLSIGILTSMFTAIMGTRAVVELIYGSRKKIEKLWI